MEAIAAGNRPFPAKRNPAVNLGFFSWAILLGLLVGIAGVWSSNKEVLGLFHDDGIYAVVAKSLSNGAGYQIISLPYCSGSNQIPISLFLYSFLAMWSSDPKFPDNIGLLKAANAAFLAAIFVLSYLFYRRRVKGQESEGLLFAALVLHQSGCVFLSQILRSATSCFFCFLSALVIFDASEQCTSRPASVTLLALIVALGCLTRSAAVP